MLKYVVIGKPIVHPSNIFALDMADWESDIQDKVIYTNERYLPRILVDCGVVKSTSEVRRNKPELCRDLKDLDVLDIRWGKKIVSIIVGE